jgi:hypothetical protein
MSPPITGFRLDAVHTFQVRTLRSLGYKTRVALSNASDGKPEFETAYRVDVSVHGAELTTFFDVARIAPRKKLLIDCEQFVEGIERDVEIIFHLIPLRHTAVDGLVSITREELFFLFTVQDHYVEYYRDDGFASGVLYQSGAFNYEKFSKEATSIIQAPKIYVGEDLDTIISVLNSCPIPGYTKAAQFKCSLQHGEQRVSWVEELPPYAPVSISLRDRARSLVTLGAEPTFLHFWGLCETATLVPLTINRDLRTGCIGIEHSLPPIYYATSVTGKLRARTVAGLTQSAVWR